MDGINGMNGMNGTNDIYGMNGIYGMQGRAVYMHACAARLSCWEKHHVLNPGPMQSNRHLIEHGLLGTRGAMSR